MNDPQHVWGFEVRFTRRRYGRRTYTWAHVKRGDEWYTCGDPWPGVNWPKFELMRAIEDTLQQINA